MRIFWETIEPRTSIMVEPLLAISMRMEREGNANMTMDQKR